MVELGGAGEEEPRDLRDRDERRLLGGGQHDEPRERHREQERPQRQVGAGEAASARRRRRGRRLLAGLRRRGDVQSTVAMADGSLAQRQLVS